MLRLFSVLTPVSLSYRSRGKPWWLPFDFCLERYTAERQIISYFEGFAGWAGLCRTGSFDV